MARKATLPPLTLNLSKGERPHVILSAADESKGAIDRTVVLFFLEKR